MTKVDSSSFPSLVFELLNGEEYSIGLHGIGPESSKWSVQMSDTSAVADKIIEEGLRVAGNRTINGTVAFQGRIDYKEDAEQIGDGLRHYRWESATRYVLVALPVTFRDAHGNQIFGGKNNLKNNFDIAYQLTCLTDCIILDKENKLPPEYILGIYELLPDGNIEFELNDKHISQNGGVLSDEEFERLNENYNNSLYGFDKLKELLTKKELTETDYTLLETYYMVCSSALGVNKNRFLPSITETIKQLIDDRDILRAKVSDYDSVNKKDSEIDYKSRYAGLSGEDLYRAELHTIYDSHLQYTFIDGVDYPSVSEIPGEVEEIRRILNDRDFLEILFRLDDKDTINYLTPLIMLFSSEELLTSKEVYRGIFKNDLYAVSRYEDKGILSREILMDIAKESCFTRDSIYDLGEYNDDMELVFAFIDNSNINNFPFYDDLGINDIAIKKLGDEVKTNPEFYERMNKKIQEFNDNYNAGYNLLDVEERVREAKGSSI